jgi:hypothetical protein
MPSAAGMPGAGMARPQTSFRALDLVELTGIGPLTRSMKRFARCRARPPVEGCKLARTQQGRPDSTMQRHPIGEGSGLENGSHRLYRFDSESLSAPHQPHGDVAQPAERCWQRRRRRFAPAVSTSTTALPCSSGDRASACEAWGRRFKSSRAPGCSPLRGEQGRAGPRSGPSRRSRLPDPLGQLGDEQRGRDYGRRQRPAQPSRPAPPARRLHQLRTALVGPRLRLEDTVEQLLALARDTRVARDRLEVGRSCGGWSAAGTGGWPPTGGPCSNTPSRPSCSCSCSPPTGRLNRPTPPEGRKLGRAAQRSLRRRRAVNPVSRRTAVGMATANGRMPPASTVRCGATASRSALLAVTASVPWVAVTAT